MITVEQLNALYAAKLEQTGSHDAAILKILWVAYKQGHADGLAGKPSEPEPDIK